MELFRKINGMYNIPEVICCDPETKYDCVIPAGSEKQSVKRIKKITAAMSKYTGGSWKFSLVNKRENSETFQLEFVYKVEKE